MNSKPLTYDSLKTVLYHLDPNLRFLISIRIPSLRVTERLVPLKIDKLCFGDTLFEINKTSYSLKVCSEGRDVLFTSSSEKDVNEYGELDKISETTVLPGDVVLRPLDPHPVPPARTEKSIKGEIDYHEKKLRSGRDRLALLESIAPENFVETLGNYNHDHLNVFRYGNEAQMRALGSSPEVEASRKGAVAMTKYIIEGSEQSLRPLLNRRDNVRPSFEIRLEITSPNGVQTERVKYTAKLHSAEKSLLKMMFGNRKHVVQVKKLEICQFIPIRFPLGLKMKIRELFSICNIRHSFSALNGVVVNSSYPLEKLGIEYDSDDEQDMEHEVVQNAKSLALHFGSLETLMLPVLLNLQNKKVHASDYETLTNDEHVQLIKSWLEIGKANGTCFTFEMQNEHRGKTILDMVEQQCDGAVVEDEWVVIPMNVNLVLKLSNEFVPGRRHESWMFKMEVLLPGPTLI